MQISSNSCGVATCRSTNSFVWRQNDGGYEDPRPRAIHGVPKLFYRILKAINSHLSLAIDFDTSLDAVARRLHTPSMVILSTIASLTFAAGPLIKGCSRLTTWRVYFNFNMCHSVGKNCVWWNTCSTETSVVVAHAPSLNLFTCSVHYT